MNIGQTYFFACSYPLGDGSVVHAGNWGRLLEKYTPGAGAPWVLIRELVFEQVRLQYFSNKPSRLKSIFLCQSLPVLQRFVAQSRRSLDLGYSVELLQPNIPQHVGCLSELNIGDTDSISTFANRAQKYWQGQNVQEPEVLTESSVRILGRVAL